MDNGGQLPEHVYSVHKYKPLHLDTREHLPCISPIPSFQVCTLHAVSSGMMQKVEASVGFPHIADVRWRVDVTLSNSSLKRALQPSVLVQLALTDGTVHTFEVRAPHPCAPVAASGLPHAGCS
jgi:hypothetical protein